MCKQENARFSNTAMYVRKHVRFRHRLNYLPKEIPCRSNAVSAIFARSSVTRQIQSRFADFKLSRTET